MDIHQIQVKYDALADRLLLQIRTRDEQLFPIWLTRRMVIRLWPHFRGMVSGLAVSRTAPLATAVPEARDMPSSRWGRNRCCRPPSTCGRPRVRQWSW
jgi:hypothetical protein